MPLYDSVETSCEEGGSDRLGGRVGKHVHRRNGVLTEVKSFGTVRTGYWIKKLDGRYFKVKVFSSSGFVGFENRFKQKIAEV